MVKRKNHTNRNLTFKNHRNGIFKPKNWKLKQRSLKFRGLKGVDAKFKRNLRYARKGMRAAQKKIMAEKKQKLKESVPKKD